MAVDHVNKDGHPDTLVAAHPKNTNAVKYGVHSERVIAPRVAEIVAQLTESFEFTVVQRIAVEEIARCVAILEAIDRDLAERGVVDGQGEPRYLLNHRSRISGQLEKWLSKIAASIERQSADDPAASVGRSDYLRELQWIGLGGDTSASARDRVAALKELLSSEAARPRETEIVTLNVTHREDGTERLEIIADADRGPTDADL